MKIMIDKKKLREDYKNIIHPKGIFIIKNLKNGKVFLGGTLNLHGVLDKNKFVLNMGSHYNKQLQEDWKEYGSESFSFEIAETLPLKEDANYNYDEDLKIMEMLWVDKFRPTEQNCYNKSENIRTV
ncbi:MAG: hypothetical protein HW421_4025 [Ignavibacteria bacterium]|nr:hypothetical protein [Ignavibacteria bacterium]